MYSLMIVEDELLARLALKNSINWSAYKITTIFEACDGLEAIKKFDANNPDILLVDINIPYLNGIELIKEIRKRNKQVKIIIISCIEDFCHAKDAIELGVSQYLLKASMSIDEINLALQKVVNEMSSIDSYSQDFINRNKESSLQIKKTAYLKQILSGGDVIHDNEGIFSTNQSMIVVVFTFKFLSLQDDDFSQELLNNMNFVENIISSTVKAYFECDIVLTENQNYVLIIHLDKSTQKTNVMDKLVETVSDAIKLILKYTTSLVNCGISDLTDDDYSNLLTSYHMAQRRLWHSIFAKIPIGVNVSEEQMSVQFKKDWDEQACAIQRQLCHLGIADIDNYINAYPQFSTSYKEDIHNYFIRLINKIVAEVSSPNFHTDAELMDLFSNQIRKCTQMPACSDLFHFCLCKKGY